MTLSNIAAHERRAHGLGLLMRGCSSPWAGFLSRRLWRFLVSLWALVTAAFMMIHLVPGDPVRAALGATAPTPLVEAQREALGLTDPLLNQYGQYLTRLISGDLGTSMTSNLPVSQVIGDRLPATLALAILAFAVAMVIAIPIGVFMAVVTRGGRHHATEVTFTTAGIVAAAVPEFLLAVGLVYVFSIQAGWFPVAGRGAASSYVLPVISLALGPSMILARIVRVEMLSVLSTDYVRTARSKRLPSPVIYLHHALPNALTATLTLAGLLLTGLVAGTVLVENVFAWPGLGSMVVQSILAKDFPVVQGIVLVYGGLVLLVNLLVDVLLAVLDPRSTIQDL